MDRREREPIFTKRVTDFIRRLETRPTDATASQLAGPNLRSNIEAIAAYTARHVELHQAHHFLYDLRCPPVGNPKYVVMGVNPGETEADWKLSPSPTEETSRYDFHTHATKGRSAIRWSKSSQYFLDGADHVLAELFFWSSYDSKEFIGRYGPIATSPHLGFCRDMNRDVIKTYAPKAVILPGLGNVKLAASLYGLKHIHTVDVSGIRVAERYDDNGLPWLFTKHWTAAFGFSKAQREAVREAIRSLG